MINVSELKGEMARQGKSNTYMAKRCGVTPKTWYSWMEKQTMPTDKAEIVVGDLELQNPALIFFASSSRHT